MTENLRRQPPARRMPTGVLIIIVIFIAGLSFTLGALNGHIFSAVGSLFGAKTYAGSIDLSSVQDTYRALKANYDGEIDDRKLIEGANKGLVEAVGDLYTVYMNPEESSDFDDSLTGTIGGGVGVELSLRNDRITIIRLLRDNPAEKAGLRAGDVLLSVNGEEVTDWTTEEAAQKIRGDVGTTVKLTVLRGSDPLEFTLTRALVNNPSVYTSIEDSIGILTITRFDDETGDLARAAARDFKAKNVRGVVLDLRSNGGGYVTAAQEVASLWLENELIVTERSGDRVVDELRSGRTALLKDMPTVVLVNGSSASASEIVAGALKDHGVARIVGERTFGKGSVQQLISLPAGAELKVTVARWYTPSGKNISDQGITPDTVVSLEQTDIDAGRDPQLHAAKQAL